MNLSNLPAYELVKQETIKDIQSEGYLLRHKKTGARIAVLENEDNNKVFNIAFRTTPTNSTGVAHIMEHTVLCGSRLFPAKDPFVELAKGSMNTFLNAMTYPDKTMFPVASCNEKDYCNLMHVYLDAVFYPNIYKKKEIFLQEGWHYELEEETGEIIYNGVVYNEMKGAYSTPEDVMEREIMNSLYPDTTYGVDSGGDPEVIPELTYEDYLAFHQKYYHPSNSYIYFYGNMDFEERLQWLDQEYLSQYDYCKVDSEITMQKPYEQCVELYKEYPIEEEEELEDNTYLSYNVAVGTSLDGELCNSFAVLEYALLSAPAAVVKQALLDAGIGKDIMGSYDSGILQPSFSIIAKNANEGDKARFIEVIEDTLRSLVENGINKKTLLAGINTMDFRFREADYGVYPKGLMYGIDMFDSWLYDENEPFTYLKQLDVYEKMRELVQTDYFEQLIQKYFLDNAHKTIVVVEPKRGLTEQKENEVKEKLRIYKESLSAQEIEGIKEQTKLLREFQETPSTPEELAQIPMLAREDIDTKAAGFYNEETSFGDTKVVWHEVFTNGIAYIDLLFDTCKVSAEEIPYLGILKAVLGMVDTEHYSYEDLNNEINMNTGGIIPGVSVYPNYKDTSDIFAFAGIRLRVLYEKVPFALQMTEEMLLHTVLDDDKRLYELIAKVKSRLSMYLASAGHSTAAARALSYTSQINAFNDALGGITFYQMIDRLEREFDKEKAALKEKLQSLMQRIYTRENLMLSVTCDKEGLEVTKNAFTAFYQKLPDAHFENADRKLELSQKNEGFTTAGQVQYVARTGNFAKAGYSYTGILRILKVIMSYEYLWVNVRVKGGAYGCMSSFGRSGDSYFVSYRDPHLKKTNEVYEHIPEYVAAFDADEHEMTKYIIGTIAELDTPLTPLIKGSRSLNAYFTGITQEMVQKERDEILQATKEQIRALAPLMQSILDTGSFCVIGNEQKLKDAQGMFKSIKMLTKA